MSGRTPPPDDPQDSAVGLLDKIAASALDDDYYLVRSEPRTRMDSLLTGVALAVFALLVTVAAVQTRVDRPATEREQQTLADDVSLRRTTQADRQSQVADLRDEVAALNAAADRDDPELEALAAQTAALPVSGPGLVIRVEPVATDGGAGDVSDRDLQLLVNGLWFVGAEAIAINDQRLGTMSSIRTAGEAITVNYTSIGAPYVIRAIGDESAMRDWFEDSPLGEDWERRAAATGLGFSLDTESDLRLPEIDPRRQVVARAEPDEDDR